MADIPPELAAATLQLTDAMSRLDNFATLLADRRAGFKSSFLAAYGRCEGSQKQVLKRDLHTVLSALNAVIS